MKEYYLIILILYSEDLPIYKYNKLILKEYMNINNEILSLFIKYDNNIDTDIKYIENENLLLIKGEEKLNNNSIINKTIKAIKFCDDNYKFKYILRTNCSTFWIYDNLLNFLKLDNKRNYIYGWMIYYINNFNIREYFISGTGIIIQYKLIKILFNLNEFKYEMDDIEISQYYIANGINLKNALKHNSNYLYKFEFDSLDKIYTAFDKINDKNICFRIKSTANREYYDKYILDNLLLKYYNKKINSIDNKLYNISIKNKIILYTSVKANNYTGAIIKKIKKYLNNEIINTTEYLNADIIISHITDRKKSFNENALNIIMSGESKDILDTYDIYIGTRISSKALITIYIPYLYLSLTERIQSINSSDYINTKKLFCAYMYSHEVTHRVEYFNLLNQYKKVDGLGKSQNNIIDIEDKLKLSNDETFLDKAVKIYTNYKFVLALENFYQDGYFTEKIINPLIANSIPIYWGTSDVFKYINKKRVIYIQDYKNNEDLMNKIIELDNSDEEYNKIISEPIYIDGQIPENLFDDLDNKIRSIFI